MSLREPVDLIAARGGPLVVPTVASLASQFGVDELVTAPAPREYVVDPYIPKRTVAVLVGAGGTCKTSLSTMITAAVCLGEDLFGHACAAGPVLYVTAEDRREDLLRHFYQVVRGRAAEIVQRVAQRLFVVDATGIDFKLVRPIDGASSVTQQADELAEYARSINAVLVVIDTVSRVNGSGEDNEGLARVVEGGERIARVADTSVLLLHHVGKQQMRDGAADQYGGRGGSAMSDNARSVLHLAVATDPQKTPIADAESMVPAGDVLVLSHVKANYSTKADPVYLHRRRGSYAADLVRLPVAAPSDPAARTWGQIAEWLSVQREVSFPTRATIDGLDHVGTRSLRRAALQYAIDRQLVSELPHPRPTRTLTTYFVASADLLSAGAYRTASDGS